MGKKVLSNYRYFYFFILACFIQQPLEAAWTLPPQTASLEDSTNAQIGIDGNGNAVAIWQAFDGMKTSIQTADFPKGSQSWSPITHLSSIVGDDSISLPQIAINPNGQAVAIWRESIESPMTLKASIRQYGEDWSFPTNIAISPIIHTPRIAIAPSGKAIVVWQGESDHLYSSSLSDTGVWLSPISLSPNEESATLPLVGMDGKGNAVAIWISQVFPNFIVRAAILPVGSNQWGDLVNLSDPIEVNANEPVLAINDSGHVVAAWVGFNGRDFLVQAVSLSSLIGGSWSASVNLSKGPIALQPVLAIDSSGNALALWSQIEHDSRVTASYRPLGEEWQSPVILSRGEVFSYDSSLAFDPAGNAIAVWNRDNLLDLVIQATILPLEGGWLAPIDLSIKGEIADFPSVVIDPTGYAVVIWNEKTRGVIESATWIPQPIVLDILHHDGPTTGGNPVTIIGTNFMNVIDVAFGSDSALSFIVNDLTNIAALPPPTEPKTVDVTVRTLSGVSPLTPNDQYTYKTHPLFPVLAHLERNYGPDSGGNSIKLVGANFVNVAEVTFSGNRALKYLVVSPNLIIATVPPGSGCVDVQVRTADGASPILPVCRYTYF